MSRPVSPENAVTPDELGVLTVNLLEGTEVRPSKRKSCLTRRLEGQSESIRTRSHAFIHTPSGSKKEAGICQSGRSLALHFVTRASSKLAIAAAARSLGRMHVRNMIAKGTGRESRLFDLSTDVLESLLEGQFGSRALIVPDAIYCFQEGMTAYLPRIYCWCTPSIRSNLTPSRWSCMDSLHGRLD